MSYVTKKSALAAARKAHGSDWAKSHVVELLEDKWIITQIAELETEPEVETEAPVPGVLSALLQNLAGAPVPEAPAVPAPEAPAHKGLVIEANRPMQNGIKCPSAGSACRAVWDFCWSAAPAIPTVAQVKAHAVKMGWNVNNASIEYYCWRKYNGISGRVSAPVVPAPAPVPVTAEEGASTLAALGL